MRHRALALAAALAAGAAAIVHTQSDARASAPFTVHEWGTFTSIAGPDGQAMPWRPLNGASELPCFVQELNPNSVKAPRGGIPALSATVRMETPVLYFYSQTKQTVRARVDFPHGLMSEWYPRAIVPPVAPVPTMQNALGALEWTSVDLVPGMAERFPTEPGEASHYYAARKTDATPLRVGDQQEKFLFYRGIASFNVPIAAQVNATGAVEVRNDRTRPIATFVLFERRGARAGYRIVSGVGGDMTIERPSLTANLDSMRDDLRRLLTSQGLYPRESAAMVETWRDSWFEEGARLFYLLPPQTVDAILPLQIEPRPSGIQRVFVGRIEIVTPEIQSDLRRALSAGDQATLRKYGRFLEPMTAFLRARPGALPDDAKVARALESVANANGPRPSCSVPQSAHPAGA
jgi:hypothetical protein